MPRFLAYICPRTDRLFKEKDAYIAHLRMLARASLQEKRIARESRGLQSDFVRLRESATGPLDIVEWLFNNSEEIMRVAFTIKPALASNMRKITAQSKVREINCGNLNMSHAALGHQVDVDIVVPFISRYGEPSLIAGSVAFQPCIKGRIAFLEAVDTFLFQMPGIKSNFIGKNELWLYLYAEDWQFVAKKALYEMRAREGDIEKDYSLERIISRRFPSVTFESYRALCVSGLLEEDMLGAPALENWLERGTEAAMQLPPLVEPGICAP